MKRYFIVLFLMMLVLNGCGGTKEKASTDEKEKTVSTDAASNQTDFTPGISVDFDKAKNDYITDDILKTLKENLQSIIDKNQQNFVKGFIAGREKSNLFWLEGSKQYQFNEIATTQHEGERINITINYKSSDNGTIEDNSMTYTFLEDKTNGWKIATID
ncbi:hypothetical protein PaecuDRAFT_1865 [Paenibacillus curdlanolyticus YK9]|uniref:Lipoprotein n=2 Tax=Paenibacillus curdlanolyticus TaxID=59840 RepID=E0I8B4_9BACL|nr:hypothetical protein PaecuDRAFT_1865 [Paenibacillus curdlanolyticus YK9]